ncbi:GNAT family N-acetyltransferase [Actinacidiphila glaucinigra]|uniref:GNAT family N-acetyltransferase n=1 Tax=Actinacidiphila glaucinigra TaxID=235986 RepID=UPI0033BE3666
MVQVTPAAKKDAEEISRLIGEIEVYYGGAYAPGDLGQIRAVIFGAHPAATVLLARDGEDVVGMASFSLLWPAAGADTSAWMKELYVRDGARGRGIGRALIGAVRAAALELGCTRLEWTADTDNRPRWASTRPSAYRRTRGRPYTDSHFEDRSALGAVGPVSPSSLGMDWALPCCVRAWRSTAEGSVALLVAARPTHDPPPPHSGGGRVVGRCQSGHLRGRPRGTRVGRRRAESPFQCGHR